MNRKIIITGASRGVGRAAAERFAKAGDRLLLCGFRNSGALSEAAGACTRLGAAEVFCFSGDLAELSEVRELFALSDRVLGVPDLLVNNAGISLTGLLQELSDEQSLQLFQTNLLSAVRCSREAVKRMLSVHRGRILNISSVFGSVGGSCEAEYSASKGGIDAFTKALAKELAPSGISVNALSLGAIDTEMNGHLSEEERQALCDEIPAGRMGSPAEAAEMLFLLSQAPLYLTGSVIKFDGGWT